MCPKLGTSAFGLAACSFPRVPSLDTQSQYPPPPPPPLKCFFCFSKDSISGHTQILKVLNNPEQHAIYYGFGLGYFCVGNPGIHDAKQRHLLASYQQSKMVSTPRKRGVQGVCCSGCMEADPINSLQWFWGGFALSCQPPYWLSGTGDTPSPSGSFQLRHVSLFRETPKKNEKKKTINVAFPLVSLQNGKQSKTHLKTNKDRAKGTLIQTKVLRPVRPVRLRQIRLARPGPGEAPGRSQGHGRHLRRPGAHRAGGLGLGRVSERS